MSQRLLSGCSLQPTPPHGTDMLLQYSAFKQFQQITATTVIHMKRSNPHSTKEDDLLMDLAFHNVPPSLLMEFSERIVEPVYGGNLTSALKDLFEKALSEQHMVATHIVGFRGSISPLQ